MNPRIKSKLFIAIGAIFLLAGASSSSHAFVLELGGGAANRSNGLYLHNRDGREIELVEVDARQDDLPILSDLGQPSVSDDGSVLFGGMVFEARMPRWIMFRAEAGDSIGRVARISVPSSHGAFPEPVVNVDPRPEVDAAGGVIFVARDSSNSEAIFRIAEGELSRLVAIGDKIPDGRRLKHIEFGSVTSWAPGACAFIGFLEGDKQAELIFSGDGLRAMAIEGEAAAGGGVFKKNFGLPAAVSPLPRAEGTLAAFTARTTAGEGLFVYDSKLEQVPLSGMSCGKAGLNFYSTGRPGLDANGRIALLAQCGTTPVLVSADVYRRREVLVSTNPDAQAGPVLASVADPVVLNSGAILFGGSNADRREAVYELTSGKTLEDLTMPRAEALPAADTLESTKHTVCAVTMSANRNGDFAYLGSALPGN
ncbi:MAG: hypothetical protein Q7S58_21705 [Candidatus Binatus sp.]|uniref:DUF7453 family protein n=1 Tax=Candidatus Binatus sp. TaxID=2811406 RepID=UPI00271564AE|nr:hypothetical protein [Candidatus Binatus sp.]MDO8435023.1 hypothetical protein [Candidatus Binatus sp.]